MTAGGSRGGCLDAEDVSVEKGLGASGSALTGFAPFSNSFRRSSS